MSNHPKAKIESNIGSQLTKNEIRNKVLRFYRGAADKLEQTESNVGSVDYRAGEHDALLKVLDLFAYGQEQEDWHQEIFGNTEVRTNE